MPLTVLEFYSGIGGLHSALVESGIDAVVVRAFDCERTVCDVYTLNHGPGVVEQTDISTLTADALADLDADIWLLSPSCQPFTVLNPNQQGMRDPRSKSFLHLISTVLPTLAERGNSPSSILLENVAGFQASGASHWLVSLLSDAQYTVHQFLLSPSQFGVPNSRLRYYLLAKRNQNPPRSPVLFRALPNTPHDLPCRPIREYLDLDLDLSEYSIPDNVLRRWGKVFDIVLPSSTSSCCFTRGYTHLVQGAGSILQQNELLDTSEQFSSFEKTGDIELLRQLRLRYFTPSELTRLFQLQPRDSSLESSTNFQWPPSITRKTKYRLIGNSINVTVVSALIGYLIHEM